MEALYIFLILSEKIEFIGATNSFDASIPLTYQIHQLRLVSYLTTCCRFRVRTQGPPAAAAGLNTGLLPAEGGATSEVGRQGGGCQATALHSSPPAEGGPFPATVPPETRSPAAEAEARGRCWS